MSFTVTGSNRIRKAVLASMMSAVAAVPLLLAYSNLPPIGRTGAPGESTCTDCHNGVSPNTASVSVTFPGGMTYTPGVKQRLRVTVSETGKSRWGFELSARLASSPTTSQAGDLAAVDTLTQVRCGDGSIKTAAGCSTTAPLQFIAQTSVGSQAGTANSGSWDLDWTPPATGAGNVTIYVAGLASNNDGGTGGDDTVTANYTLSPAAPPTLPTLTVSPMSISFASVVGTAPASQTFHVTSSGTALAFTTLAASTGGTWLSATPSGGTTPSDVTVAANTTGLVAGTYTGTVTVASTGASNSPQTVNVTLTVSPAPAQPTLTVAPSPLTFVLPTGGAASSQSVQVSATTTGLAFTAAAATTTGGAWLSVTPASGSTPAPLTVTADPSLLSPGTYSGTVTVTAAGASNSPQTVPVTLTVTNASLTLSPTSMTFQSPSGGTTVPAQNLQVTSSGAALAFTAAAATTTGGSWLAVTPASGNTPATLSVSVNPTGLADGTYNGTISITSANAANSPRSVPVTLVVGTVTPPPTVSDLFYRFSVLDKQTDGPEQLLLSGNGAVASGVLSGSGTFSRFTVSGSGRHSILASGTWKAKELVSYTPATVAASTNNGDDRSFEQEDHGDNSDATRTGGVLVITVDLLPTGGTPVPATFRIASTGTDYGVSVQITGGASYVPTGTGSVTIRPATTKTGDDSDATEEGGSSH